MSVKLKRTKSRQGNSERNAIPKDSGYYISRRISKPQDITDYQGRNKHLSQGSSSGLDNLHQRNPAGSSLGLGSQAILQDECSLCGAVDSKVSELSAKTASGEEIPRKEKEQRVEKMGWVCGSAGNSSSMREARGSAF